MPSVMFSWQTFPKLVIWPIFLPFLGCRAHCVFCNQRTQTGQDAIASLSQLQRLLQGVEDSLRERRKLRQMVPQLAFYGGTFTAMPPVYLELCLEAAKKWRDLKLISGFRCSTRPDCLNTDIITHLQDAGCVLVELGLQTFALEALCQTGRGYGPEQAMEACSLLRTNNMDFGIQLMPGMPGSQHGDFLRDVHIAIEQGARCLRFYPCLVLAETNLEAIWRNGNFQPWSLTRAMDQLAQGILLAIQASIPVIRMGLAPQSGLKILAGPWHNALGSRVMGRALALLVARQHVYSPITLTVPKSAQGYIWGWRQELADFWKRQRLTEVKYWQHPRILLEYM